MVLELIERSHPDYDREMADALNTALTDLEHRSAITADEIDDWIANIFDNARCACNSCRGSKFSH